MKWTKEEEIDYKDWEGKDTSNIIDVFECKAKDISFEGSNLLEYRSFRNNEDVKFVMYDDFCSITKHMRGIILYYETYLNALKAQLHKYGK